jgi:hypothetical protein
MRGQDPDALVDIDPLRARVQVLSSEAKDWIETHVTLEQVQAWTGAVLEVASSHIGDLITGMFADGLKISTACGWAIEHRTRCCNALFPTQVSQN